MANLMSCIPEDQRGMQWKRKWEADRRAKNNKPRPEVVQKWREWKACSERSIDGR